MQKRDLIIAGLSLVCSFISLVSLYDLLMCVRESVKREICENVYCN